MSEALCNFSRKKHTIAQVTEICPGGELFDRIVELKSLGEVEACKIVRYN